MLSLEDHQSKTFPSIKTSVRPVSTVSGSDESPITPKVLSNGTSPVFVTLLESPSENTKNTQNILSKESQVEWLTALEDESKTAPVSGSSQVTAPIQDMNSVKKPFTAYLVKVKASNGYTWVIHRRYSEFLMLDKSIRKVFQNDALPILPPKRYLGNNLDSDFIHLRAAALNKYLSDLFLIPELIHSEPLREFLCGHLEAEERAFLNSEESGPSLSLDSLDDSDHNNHVQLSSFSPVFASTQSPASSSWKFWKNEKTNSENEPLLLDDPISSDSKHLTRKPSWKFKMKRKTAQKHLDAKANAKDSPPFSDLDSPKQSVVLVPEEDYSKNMLFPLSGSKEAANYSSNFKSWLKRVPNWKRPQSPAPSVVEASQGMPADILSTPIPEIKGHPESPPVSPKSGVDGESTEDMRAVAHIPAVVGLQDFFLLKLIGRGNFGKVLLAQHKDTERLYAIKVISKAAVKKKSKGSSPHDIDHIMAERNVLIRSVKHPFLIGLRWAFQTTERLYFVTDYVNGGELFFHLQRERRFPEVRARFYAAEMVSALAYLHVEVDVVYRDLKPENILLDSEGHIKLTDFGLAKEHFHELNSGRTQTFCGTPEYLAPEVLRKEPYGFPVDWWCVGAVLYEMLVGLPPFYSKDTQEMYDRILHEKLKFPHHVSLRARSIISGLLHRSSHFRLGTGANNTSSPQSVKTHPFFEDIDWKKLARREIQPPYVPDVRHSFDLRNIDPAFVNEPIPERDNAMAKNPGSAGWTVAVQPSQLFKGFSFAGDDGLLSSAVTEFDE